MGGNIWLAWRGVAWRGFLEFAALFANCFPNTLALALAPSLLGQRPVMRSLGGKSLDWGLQDFLIFDFYLFWCVKETTHSA